MNKLLSKIITVYVLLWIAILHLIIKTQKEIGLYYNTIYTFFIGLIILLVLISLKKYTQLHEAKRNNSRFDNEMIGVAIWVGLLLFVLFLVVTFTLLF